MRWTYEFKVGLFSIGALLIIAYMFFVLSPDTFQSASDHDYFTIIDDAGGIVVKTQVKTNGVVVGKVKNVRLDGNQSRIDFSVRSDIKLPRGSEVQIREKGLLGDVFLEIVRGEDKGDYLKDGEFLPPAKDQVSISKLVNVANAIGKDIKKITGTFADIMGGEEGRKNVASIINDVRDVAASLKSILSENRTEFKNIMTNLDRTTSVLEEVVAGKKHDLAAIVTNIRQITETLKEVLRPENRERIDRILASLDSTGSDIKTIAAKINNGEGTLGRLVNDDKMINDFEGAVKDLRGLIAPAKRMEVQVDFHAEYAGNSRTQGFIDLIIKPRPDKFYLIGITDVITTEKEVFYETLPPEKGQADASATTATRYKKSTFERNALRFNVQYAQRWFFAQLRFGLFQTTGGLATDLYFFNDRLKYSFEAFDFRKSSERNFARLKTYASILFFNHVYAMVGADDLTRLDRNGRKTSPLYFFGGGFNFTDEDLKSLFGLAAAGSKL